MSPKLLLLTLPVLLLLSGCLWSPTKDPISTDIASITESLSWTTPMTDIVAPSLADCKASVEAYLSTAKSTKVDKTSIVKKDSQVIVDYIGRLTDGTVFDTSVESIAKACGKYTPQRNYTDWLPFKVGAWEMIAGFDTWVLGMSVGETKTINILSKDAYGADIVSYPISQLPSKPDKSSYKVGESIMTMNGEIKIESINDKEFTIKNNHPLGGKDLIFDITIKSVK